MWCTWRTWTQKGFVCTRCIYSEGGSTTRQHETHGYPLRRSSAEGNWVTAEGWRRLVVLEAAGTCRRRVYPRDRLNVWWYEMMLILKVSYKSALNIGRIILCKNSRWFNFDMIFNHCLISSTSVLLFLCLYNKSLPWFHFFLTIPDVSLYTPYTSMYTLMYLSQRFTLQPRTTCRVR